MYALEMIFDNERASYVAERLAFLQRSFPTVRERSHSTCYVIAGCERTSALTPGEKALLLSYIEQGILHRFRCKRI